MNIEIRRSGGEPCATCGSLPLIAVLPHPDHPGRDLRVALADALGLAEQPRWRPLRRRWTRQTVASLAAAEQRLLELTRFPVA